jgi:23S rRNA (guanosine2251-2'-O)-methyltransferase
MEFELLAADLHGTDLKEYKNTQNPKQALFLGNEHEGLSNKILKKMDTKLSIKMHRDFDSLNVSVAAGIMIYSLKK